MSSTFFFNFTSSGHFREFKFLVFDEKMFVSLVVDTAL